MGVGEKPEIIDQEAPSQARDGGNGGRGSPRKSARKRSTESDVEVPLEQNAPTKDRRASRERSLNRLLAGLRAVNAGDFSVELTPNGDPLMAEIIDVFNGVVQKQARVADEIVRVSTSVGREGKMSERVSVVGMAGQWMTAVDAINSLITDLAQPTTEVSRVIQAVAEGDLSQKVELEIEGKLVQGEFLRIGSTVNRMVDQLNAFASEVTRVAREVGTEGVLGGQANVPGVAGTWKDLTDSVNAMASNLTNQVRNIALVTTAVANGDLSRQITVEAKGEVLELKNTINTMVDQLSAFAAEVTRVAKEVGTDGKLGGQANVPGVAGTWKGLTDNVNFMAANLTNQVRNIALVTTAVANGDLSQKITVEVRGEILELKNTINDMVDRLRIFADEVTRVAREVGTEGVLGGQATVPGVAGTWKGLTDNVNAMAGNLTAQVRNIADVTTAVAKGDLSRKITVNVQGEVLELKNTINTMVDQLNAFANEVTRVAKEVGTEGKLGGQARVEGVSGTWRDLTQNVNGMAANLTVQLRDVSAVATAIANGDLTRKITVEAQGEILQIKDVVNRMVDQLNSFAGEVVRVAREVGTEGVLGGQAEVRGVSGSWKDLTDNVNFMAANLTNQVRNIADVTTAVAKGDLSRKITVEAKGEVQALKNTINTMVEQLSAFASEVTRVAREVGTEGRLGGQASVPGVGGTWKDLTDNVNAMASNLTVQVRNIADVTTAVARGDLSRKITVDVRGEILELKNTINTMVDQLNGFASEVTRVAREVGTEGKLGGQAKVTGAGGVWRDLTDSVNVLAANLTTQVRNVADVTTAVANGDLSQKITVEAQGEILSLKNTMNNMVDRLRVFADEVTRVAKEVGTEGKLGGQAEVPGVSGTWKGLTDSVNAMANSLTMQVRNIADVATSVTKGDLTRQITVDAQGELDELKTNINQMIANLRETTERNQEQDWLKTNLAKFSRMMQGQKDLESVSRLIMSELTPLVSAHHGAFFIADQETATTGQLLKLIASYAYRARKHVANRFTLGEGLVGQAALEKQPILLQNVPDDYIQITSGLGEAPPRNIIVLPILFEGEVKAVIELASFLPFSQIHQTFLDQLAESIGVVLNMIQANMRTEELLEQSQKLTQELQSQSKELQQQQEELKRSNSELEQQARTLRQSEELLKEQQEELQQVNEELEEKASLLAEQNARVEQKNREVESARVALEEKAEQLSLSSKYKNEFLANMSHELRTPLNSLLILAKLLVENKDRNLSNKQVEFAQTIYSSGTDLLNLINDILDLSKVEAGKMEVNFVDVPISEVRDFVERTFRPVAEQKSLPFRVEIAPDIPSSLYTDGQRLQQVLKNLLSNAFKFTERGSITLTVDRASTNLRFASRSLDRSPDGVIAFSVRDTGIGIPRDKQQLIFEAFQQADGTTSRKFGGTGLGLSISRELARLLGGEIRVESTPGTGSTFTLYLPVVGTERRASAPRQLAPADRAQSSSRAIEQPSNPAAEATQPWDDDAGGGVVTEAPRRRSLDKPQMADDREDIVPSDRVVLIMENDTNFARILLDMARDKGFKGIVALDGESGLDLAHAFHPDAITLDIDMPGMDGWAVLDRLKHHPETRHIPVHIITGIGDRQHGLKAGAIAYLEKPVSKEALEGSFAKIESFIDQQVKRLLVVEDDESQRRSMIELISHEDVEITAVASAQEALDELHKTRFDCMVLDLGLAGGTDGFQLLETVKADPEMQELPIIIYTGRELTQEEETRLRRFAETIIVKDVKSPERLLDETALFLHRVEARLPEQKRRMLERLHSTDAVFAGKHVLVVDDDVRNIFSLTSVLEQHGMNVAFAENGKDALAKLEAAESVDLVLMDVMMPEMDGYETTRAIRERARFRNLPIIALTAKAMKGDREKCIEAGASDYITKPVDTEQLLSLMRVWLYR